MSSMCGGGMMKCKLKCKSITASGAQCRRPTSRGQDMCYQHGQHSQHGLQHGGRFEIKGPKPRKSKSLYDRLGGIFAIAAVVDWFSDRILESNLVGVNSPNPQLRKWSRDQFAARLPGLKWMRTLWVADITGGPYKFVATRPGRTHLGLENAHRNLKIAPEEFDEVARILSETIDHFEIPKTEKGEVLKAFAAHKKEVNEGYFHQR